MKEHLGAIAFSVSIMFVLAQYVAALKINQWQSFVRHGGMWGDFFIVSICLGMIFQNFSSAWTLNQWLVSLAASIVISSRMAWIWAKDPTPTAHTSGGHQTLAGWIHLVYMIPVLATIGLVYFCPPPNLSPNFIVGLTVALIMHLLLGTHMVLGLLINNGIVKPDTANKDYLHDTGAWATLIISSSALVWRAWAIASR